ncbi:hypothetical protein F4680DRAFT_449599 [Xylaria scruposa]|nr:hypothetical protein F4680DRAFT_449599 [Xylaria scruposa]
MCKRSRTEMLCGHAETHFTSLCGKECSSPREVTRYLNRPCPRCDPRNIEEKQKARTAELLSQLRVGANDTEVESLTERANELNLRMQRGLAEARHMMYGTASDSSSSPSSLSTKSSNRSRKAPWDPDSGSESDEDASYLTEDGKHVVQKQYKLINGHWAMITYRKELHEVDPYLLAKLRDKRKRELAKLEAKQSKRGGKRPTRNGEYNNHITDSEEDSKIHHEKKATEKWRSVYQASGESREKSSEPSSPKVSRSISAGEQRGKKKVLQEPKGGIHEERYETRTTLQKTHKRKSFESHYSSDSFRARAEKDGFHPTSDEESEQEPAQTEGSGGRTAHRRLRRVKRTWVERFAEDITYSSADSSSDADSVVTVLKVPVYQSGKKSRKSAGHGKSQSQTSADEEEDIWHKIADEE